MRVQVILSLVAALVLVAVPLYLWRRPQPATIPSADAATSNQAAPLLSAPLGGAQAAVAAEATLPNGSPQLVPSPIGPVVEVAPVKTLKCQDPGLSKTPPERCDGLRSVEDALVRAIKESASCAPTSKNGYVASFVLEAHFGKKRTNLFFGKSTTLSKGRRRELLRCVEKALSSPEWDRIPHQHQRYSLNAVATYPASSDPTVTRDDEASDSAPPKPTKAAPAKSAKPVLKTRSGTKSPTKTVKKK